MKKVLLILMTCLLLSTNVISYKVEAELLVIKEVPESVENEEVETGSVESKSGDDKQETNEQTESTSGGNEPVDPETGEGNPEESTQKDKESFDVPVNIPMVSTSPVIGNSNNNEPEPNYLTFTALKDNSSVLFKAYSGEAYYSTNKSGETSGWIEIENLKKTRFPIKLNAGDSVSFSGNNVRTSSLYHFSMSGLISASGDVTSLTNGVGGDCELYDYCYSYMFQGCKELITAPNLPSKELSNNCYAYMFDGCTSLSEVTESLSGVTELANRCYANMFRGCTRLTTIPENLLPVDELKVECYKSMFNSCSGLETIPENLLPATTLADSCYSNMFKDCTGLKTVPSELLSVSVSGNPIPLATNCYISMFSGCEKLANVPDLPATSLSGGCYSYMFNGCSSIKLSRSNKTGTNIGSISFSGVTPVNNCFDHMFDNTGGIFSGKPNTSETYYFYRENDLISQPNYLTFTALEDNSSVTFKAASGSNVYYKKGEENWIQISDNVFSSSGIKIDLEKGKSVSFSGIDVKTDSKHYFSMTGSISGSGDMTSLTNGVGGDCELTNSCYSFSFSGCTALTNVPNLPSTMLAANCYSNMFKGCTGLTTVPKDLLKADDLTKKCYISMFSGCENLKNIPDLQTDNFAENCYSYMFKDCASIKLSKSKYTGSPLGTISFSDKNYINGCLYNMFVNTGADFNGTPTTNKTYYFYEENPNYLTFTATKSGSSITFEAASGDAYYSTDGSEWKKISDVQTGVTINLKNIGYSVSFSGINVKTDSSHHFSMSESGLISASGDVTSLTNGFGGDSYLSYASYSYMFSGCKALTNVPNLPSTKLATDCYKFMFKDCTSLSGIPENLLPATTLAESCYSNMFRGCTGLKTVPKDLLKADVLEPKCYISMFNGCDNLTNTPALPAASLSNDCYSFMFKDCRSLSGVPNNLLPATSLTDKCYYKMFYGCKALTNVPDLPAGKSASGNLAEKCYSYMFSGCTSLSGVPNDLLPAASLSNDCYSHMFDGCKSLKTVPALSATILADKCYSYMFNDCESLVFVENPKSDVGHLLFTCTKSGVCPSEDEFANPFAYMFMNTNSKGLRPIEDNKYYWYDVNIEEGNNNPVSYESKSGSNVSIYIKPIKNSEIEYTLHEFTIKDTNGKKISVDVKEVIKDSLYTFEMPLSKVNIYPTFLKLQTINFKNENIYKTVGDSDFTNPLSGANTKVDYSSSSSGVAVVSDSGLVTIKGIGETTIAAKANSESGYASASGSYQLIVFANVDDNPADIDTSKSNLIVSGNNLSKTATEEKFSDIVIDIVDTYTDSCSGWLEKDGNKVIDVELSEGSIKATIPAEFLNNLPVGVHNFTLFIDNGNINHKHTYEYNLSITVRARNSSNPDRYKIVKTYVN